MTRLYTIKSTKSTHGLLATGFGTLSYVSCFIWLVKPVARLTWDLEGKRYPPSWGLLKDLVTPDPAAALRERVTWRSSDRA